MLEIYKTYKFKNLKWLLQRKLFDKSSEENTIKTKPAFTQQQYKRQSGNVSRYIQLFFHFTQTHHYSLSLDTWLSSKKNHKAKSLAGGFNTITKERSLAS